MPRVVWLPAFCVAVLALAGPPAAAEMCALDAVPAATLLLPYFEVDLGAAPGAGVNTVFTIHNALPEPALAHLTFWTDWSQPVMNFDVFLTGYDAQTFDLYDVFVGANIPVTADEQSDQGQDGGRVADPTSTCDGTIDSCSPHGLPSWDGSFEGNGASFAFDCIAIFPFFVNPLIPPSFQDRLQAQLTGQPFQGACYGADHGDGVARGYVTIDNAQACSLIFPSDPEYFSDGAGPGIASNVNQLWGDWALIDGQAPVYTLDPLVHIEADDDFDSSSTATNYTFYGRYTQALGGIDNREPLASAWSFSYFNAEPSLATDLIVWRDSTANNQTFDGYPCGSGPGTGPDWQPLDQTQVVCFDRQENAVEICAETPCFPLESQRLAFGAGDLTVRDPSGWCRLNLNIPGDAVTGDVDFPASPPGDVAQSWVGATHRRAAAVTGGLSAVLQAHACQDSNPVIGLDGGRVRR